MRVLPLRSTMYQSCAGAEGVRLYSRTGKCRYRSSLSSFRGRYTQSEGERSRTHVSLSLKSEKGESPFSADPAVDKGPLNLFRSATEAWTRSVLCAGVCFVVVIVLSSEENIPFKGKPSTSLSIPRAYSAFQMVEPYPNTTPGIESARLPDCKTFFQLSQVVVTRTVRGAQSAFETSEDPGISSYQLRYG